LNSAIQISKLSKFFGDLHVLNEISFAVNLGEIVSILGPSGSGKTTLLRCITGLDQEYSGDITINQIDQTRFLTDNRIAFVTQKYGNFPWLTVEENIKLGLDKRKAISSGYNVEVVRLIQDLGLSGFEKSYPDQLSGGMQQRLAIGRALAQDTEILAMDEPFGALDYQTRQGLQELIKSISHRYGKTILFVTHDIEEAIFISDRIVLITKSPSVIAKEYSVPPQLRLSEELETRFADGFVGLRRQIEKDMRRLAHEDDKTEKNISLENEI